ncbi:dihydroorotate dehydrogenase electron transfer subunit [Alkalihalobacillus oceani]|uniref:dihydroorotate dehydrogenase electron transfer subunit n=1 Tax=Halalkalibacter oceani TaxID=1653776 RepID=UPI00203FEEB7|nr:dihydroorotate dehydrogenase electron transfer subunit [Halalkalibacter oceani]MCM3762325.1 dihydroorotate dehydrogenase electron transfer subunit [Halalkalibacter oceani]
MKAQQVTILTNVQVSERYWHMTVDTSEIGEKVHPGQFFNILCEQSVYPFLRRPLSVYRIDDEAKTLEFLYLVKGLGTTKMTEFKAGEKIDIFGPLGVGFDLKDEYNSILLLARGVGVATLAALAFEAAQKGKKVHAILSARSENDLLAADFLEGLGVSVYKVTDESGTSDVEKVEALIGNIMGAQAIDALYTCGSKRLSRLMQRLAIEHQLPGEIALEEHMGCAMGVCFACVCDIREGDDVKSVRVCHEGPVFPLEKVVLA